MGTFSDWNGPQTGTSANAMIKFADAYQTLLNKLNNHVSADIDPDSGRQPSAKDPHGLKDYIDKKMSTANETAINSKNAIVRLLTSVAGIDHIPVTVQDVEDHFKAKIGELDLVSFVKSLADEVKKLQDEVNTLSLIQFDNVPVGSGIRWWKDTLPEDGTYVWANGQTLFGVNQNFPELARVWEIDGSDNVVVPKETHTIFKVRKATKKIHAIEHAYIDEAHPEPEVTLAGLSTRITELSDMLTNIQAAFTALGEETNP